MMARALTTSDAAAEARDVSRPKESERCAWEGTTQSACRLQHSIRNRRPRYLEHRKAPVGCEPDIVAAGTLRTSSMVVELSGRLASLCGRRMLSRDFQLRRLNSSSCPGSRGSAEYADRTVSAPVSRE